LAIVDAEGPEALTMTRLADSLGVAAASLYNHVDGKTAVWEGIRGLVVSEMTWASFAQSPWDEALADWARSYRQAFLAHPNTFRELFASPVQSPATYAMYDQVCTALERSGWPLGQLAAVISAVEYVISGSILDRETVDTMMDLAKEHAPRFWASLQEQNPTQADSDDDFELALAALIDGLAIALKRHAVEGPVRTRPTGE
jgi:AcrR family transcriptional regulator